MLTKLKNSEPTVQDMDDLIIELKGLLSSKRYLIILDDVWVTDLWNQYLKHALPDVGNGSRVLMTSRFIEVAQSADPIMEPYELKILNDEDSRDLLIKKAFPYQKTSENFPNDLLELADELSKKCKGLPLALIVLGGILLTKDQTYTAWENELRTMDWHSKGKDCIDIIAMSYEDMPYYLKTCFLFLASFPEDYKISARCLIKMWVADGFMPQQGRKTMEEIAEDCLEQLFQRSMIQVSSRHANGSIKYCRVHDLLLDFAMHQAGKENFVTIFANPQDINHCDRATRRASLQSCGAQLTEYVGLKTRSLFLFDLKGNLLMSYSEFRLLRVLVIEVVWSDEEIVKLRGIDRLIHLKYLGISNCGILDMSECSLGRLKNLETVDIRRNNMISNLTTDLWTIDTLKYVLCHELLPEIPSTADLRNLQTLEWILFDNKTIPHLNNLRRLGLESKSIHWDVDHALPHLLGGLSSLTSLKIKSCESNLPMEIIYPKALPYYQNLQILYLDGQWPESVTLKASLFPSHLVKLTLCYSCLGQDPMSELAKLNNLKELVLTTDVYNGRQMICSAGFPVLQKLVILSLTVKILTVAKGVMPKLKYLRIYDHCKVEAPPELLHSITLF
ncbi:Disease resistance protein RPP8 [Rhynchospora pubera]|uniref:Disease resistance protein RPP8 n=1 Tax=Rhynchospora pubera TaxID=906938 RepID=A0AAV8GUN9_9POAL|nr:Disease resistance protein RPP8 [Rhynchospora pubera]